MYDLFFLIDPAASSLTLQGTFDPWLVGLSILLSVGASIMALQVAGIARPTSNPLLRQIALLSGTLALGGGIWAMHFLGMLAFSLCAQVSYDPTTTLLSVVPGLAASWVALSLLTRPQLQSRQLVLGGVLVGSGIGAMHYSGMAAMRMAPLLRYDPWWFALSLLLAIGLAMLALWIRFGLERSSRLHPLSKLLLGGTVMGTAIAGMHYTGMAAARFVGSPESQTPLPALQSDLIANEVLFGTLLLILAVLLSNAFLHYREQLRWTLRRQERFMQSLIDKLPGIAFRCRADEEWRLLFLSDGIERLSGWSTGELLAQGSLQTLVPAEDLPRLAEAIREAAEHGGSYSTEFRLRCKDGRLLQVWSLGNVTRPPRSAAGGNGEALLVDGMILDISARHALEQELRQARDSAEQASKARSLFFANMSHEIRTPINGVMGMLDLALETPLNAGQREYLETAQCSGEVLLALLDDILDVAKMDAGHLQLERIAFDLPELVEHTARLMGARARQKRLELIVEMAPGLPRQVVGDPLRLRQVLLNLLGNAIKFTERGEVALGVERSPDTDGALRFAVRDTGIGIDPQARELIFEPFRQADESTSRKYGGTGLGLSISRRLVQLMGGEIRLSSTPGLGSRFSFELTLPAQDSAETEVNASERNAVELSGLGLLIVDSVAANRLCVERHALAWGMRPHGFATPLQALAWLQDPQHAERVHIALFDRQLPELDGLELARRLRKRYPQLRLVLLSSSGDLLEASALQDGLLEQRLCKPVSPDTLVHALIDALQPRHRHPATAMEAGACAPGRLRGCRVLLVEDHPVNRLLVQRLLERQGARISEAENGCQAVQRIESGEQFDLILMDCQMPVMDGTQAAREIRRLEREHSLPRTPIVALTAYAGGAEVAECRRAGMDEVFSKPFDAHQLLDTLVALLESRACPPEEAAEPPAERPALIDDGLLDSLQKAVGDDLSKVVSFFCGHLPEQIARLQSALDEGGHAEIREQAHRIKGSAGNIGALALATLARDIEQRAAAAQALPADCATRLAQLAEASLRRLRERYPDPALGAASPHQQEAL